MSKTEKNGGAKSRLKIENVIAEDIASTVADVDALVTEFFDECEPLENILYVLADVRNLSRFCECHIPAHKLVPLATVDVPLDPEEQREIRANRDLVIAHQAFADMKDDADKRRSFSNLVLEYAKEYDAEHPLKIIGGQHRYEAIKGALEKGLADEYHGIKVYFGLNTDQRLDVQEISNTVIETPLDLLDRMQETVKGPQLRDWCKGVGLVHFDFGDKRKRGKEITVAVARTFLLNYYAGREISAVTFDQVETTPVLSKPGAADDNFEKLRLEMDFLQDPQLHEAGEQFARLIAAQRKAFEGQRGTADFAEKALNYAVLSSWAFVAGLLHNNSVRLQRHFELSNRTSKDPLNAAELAKGRHKSDVDAYRGMGSRTDPKERARFVELFFLQAESGKGISKQMIDFAIKKYHTKTAVLDQRKAEQDYFKNGGN